MIPAGFLCPRPYTWQRSRTTHRTWELGYQVTTPAGHLQWVPLNYVTDHMLEDGQAAGNIVAWLLRNATGTQEADS